MEESGEEGDGCSVVSAGDTGSTPVGVTTRAADSLAQRAAGQPSAKRAAASTGRQTTLNFGFTRSTPKQPEQPQRTGTAQKRPAAPTEPNDDQSKPLKKSKDPKTVYKPRQDHVRKKNEAQIAPLQMLRNIRADTPSGKNKDIIQRLTNCHVPDPVTYITSGLVPIPLDEDRVGCVKCTYCNNMTITNEKTTIKRHLSSKQHGDGVAKYLQTAQIQPTYQQFLSAKERKGQLERGQRLEGK